jgi:hypothetical protein
MGMMQVQALVYAAQAVSSLQAHKSALHIPEGHHSCAKLTRLEPFFLRNMVDMWPLLQIVMGIASSPAHLSQSNTTDNTHEHSAQSAHSTQS